MSEPTTVPRGVTLMVAMRWTDKLIGLLSTLILARLLVPDDFGVVAQASLVIGLLDVLTDLGVAASLIQNARATQHHFDTAWTIRLGQFLLAALAAVLIAPLAGDYFHDERVVPVIQLMCISLVLAGLENIGVITFQKEMRFGLDFRFMFLKRLAGFLVTVTLAFLWRSYWALVVGAISGRLVGVVISYSMHSMRPRLSLAEFQSVFGFSQWMLIRNIGNYLNNQYHRILVGGRSSTSVMGAYSLASEISAMPSTEVLSPLNRVLFPAFVKVKDQPDEFKRVFLLAQGVQALLAIPASVGLALVANEAVVVLLGEKWLSAVPFVEILALTYLVPAIATTPGYVLITLGRVRLNAAIAWTQFVLFFALAVLIFPAAQALQLAEIRLATALVTLLGTIAMLMRAVPELRAREVAASVARPLLGAASMAAVLQLSGSYLPTETLWSLFAKVLLGGAVYVASVLSLWLIVGRPESAEAYILKQITYLIGSRARARRQG
ncbi:MAG: lipopolysaccharide biosynthesis protein [Chromatiaceae bacterium]|nr:lipopolysaccharide biosynthesis protein [Gammaproteobacteria bacterium]MCP5422979.1 lipopolysaccharide biosynthesis protein [Chromatiaceae bacterium]